MRFASLLAASLIVAATSVHAESGKMPSPGAAKSPASTPVPEPGEGSRTRPAVGSKAPDFQYQSYDALWQNLHNVLEHGDVLLVFGATDVDLRTLEREREVLVRSRVTPLAVVEKNDRDAYTLNNITAKKSADGSVAVQFGDCDGATANCLPTVPGWNYLVRLYRPRPEVLEGRWEFPEAQVVE